MSQSELEAPSERSEEDNNIPVEPSTLVDGETSETMVPGSLSEPQEHESYQELYERMCVERDRLAKELETLGTQHKDKEKCLHEINTELERKLLVRGERVDELSVELANERESSNRRLAELEERIEQVSSQCMDMTRERDEVTGKLGLLENERRKLIDEVTTTEHKLTEATKENEKLSAAAKKHKNEASKAQANFEKSEKQCSELTREVTKLKEEVSSQAIKVKWAQNKLKTETDGHKETKSQLALSNKKLKESKEEGEQIRADLKTMIQQYQESEEMRSNSLGLKLQKTEKELKAHEQEIADQQELHELIVKELELVKASLKIAQAEVAQYKTKLSEATGKSSGQAGEIDELRRSVERMREEQDKLSTEKTELQSVSQTLESERSKFSALREAFTTMQKSHQHLEREVGRRKEREAELLTFSEKLSSANAEMKAEKCDMEAKLLSLTSERDSLTDQFRDAMEKGENEKQTLVALNESTQSEVDKLTEQVTNKSKAVEELTMALEDEKELLKANKKKNINSIRDLQRQLQQSKRRIDHLEASLQAERESPATLPITDGSRASSQNSLNELISHNHSVPNHTTMATLSAHTATQHHDTPSPDEERAVGSPSPELLFQTMDQEKLLLVERLCRNKRELAKIEEKIEFFEEHTLQLTEDIKRKSKIIQSFILREQSGALAPAAYDEHKARQSKKGGVMATVFAGGKGHSADMTYELSLEMNRKMQSILEDTLLKNITLKESIDTLGTEIQRLSAQLQAFESHRR